MAHGPKGNNVLDDSIYFARSAGKTDAFDNIVLINNRLGAHISTKGWYTNPMPNPSDASAVAGWREYGSMDLEGNSLDISGREANVAFELSAPEAAPYSDRASVFASYNGGAGWEPTPLDAPVIADVVVTTPDGDGGFGGHLMEVTGGAGGTVVTVDNGVALQNALASAKSAGTPVIIYVDGTITPANSGNLTGNINIKDLSNVSIIGVASRGEFAGIGISMRRTSNVIIQNLKIHDVPASFGDAIGIEGDDNVATGNIWVDHNELHGNLNVGKDDYDGLFDTKAGATHVTFSHNYVHDHYKSMLNGSSDDDSGERFITYRHNYFNNLESRVPLFRYGFGHLYNNVFSNINSSGINSRMGAELLIEANVFENVQNPIVSFYSREIGFWNVRDNAFTNVTYTTPDTGDAVYSPADGSTSTYEVPYDYDTYLLPVADVKDYVLANVGVGIVDQSELDIPDVADPIVDGGNDDPVVYAVLPITEDFEVASADILFSNAYKNLSGSAGSGTAMYHKVTGTVSVADGQLTITGARVSIGNTTPEHQYNCSRY
ncbi:pectate lyase family protein [Psychrosphaera algicola]|uniref:Right-handed parallel beta-helix repeat-containing protein n=1 Tax=Psychrosphaera algicola TaxID=3023714 RepID=A0ABT5FID2_9GAMM|nr:right-handed parallel beta-helix repeat-containing protein [Psychrosphaera sp. G1-22]MDC2890946.1 right-handed parallel beta-helix repeat-containing protein [Psychrosphaera sp. G1-22]